MPAILDALQRLERRPGLLGLVKLANVALAMFWGFVVTFVFVRLLPLPDFRAFLLLVAFANFTVSAEFGFSTIIYARLRRHVLTGQGGFRAEEIGVLMAFLLAIILTGAVVIAVALGAGWLKTTQPGLFLAFYCVAATNLVALLAKRGLAALDHNLWWEGLDLFRRITGISLLFAALTGGMPLMTSVLAQLVVAVLCVLLGLATVHRALGLTARHWLAVRVGGGHVRASYLGDIGRTVALTVSDVAAYNAPYFTIALATSDARPLLLFDFVFKMSRALSAAIRAFAETTMPAITRAAHGEDVAQFTGFVRRLAWRSAALAILLGTGLIVAGPWLSAELFDHHAVLSRTELVVIAALLLGLAPLCVSVYVQAGLARFAPLLPPSAAFLLGSLLSVPMSLGLASLTGWRFALCFALVYAVLHLLLGAWHVRLLRRLTP